MPLTTAHPLASNRSSSECCVLSHEELNRIIEALKQSLVSNDSINEELQLNVNQGNEIESNRMATINLKRDSLLLHCCLARYHATT